MNTYFIPITIMRAAFVTKYGGPDVLRIRESETPKPQQDEVLIQVKAIGLNFADVLMRTGIYPNAPKPPFVPGMEFSGIVIECGTSAHILKPGDRVMGYSRTGSHAEYVVVKESMAGTIPERMSFEEAASLLVIYLTAFHGLCTLGRLTEGEKVLVHAAAGGVGLAAIQLAKYFKAEVFGTIGSESKREIVKNQNADLIINYTRENFADIIRTSTKGYGVDIVMDSVGGRVFRPGWKLLAPMGRYILFGFADAMGNDSFSYLRASKAIINMPPLLSISLISSNKSIAGFNLSTLTGKKEYLRNAADRLMELYEIGIIKPIIGKVFPFEKIADAHAYLQRRKSIGKVVVTFDNA
jgi:synaptic vesicle membrane protein VAT-1